MFVGRAELRIWGSFWISGWIFPGNKRDLGAEPELWENPEFSWGNFLPSTGKVSNSEFSFIYLCLFICSYLFAFVCLYLFICIYLLYLFIFIYLNLFNLFILIYLFIYLHSFICIYFYLFISIYLFYFTFSLYFLTLFILLYLFQFVYLYLFISIYLFVFIYLNLFIGLYLFQFLYFCSPISLINSISSPAPIPASFLPKIQIFPRSSLSFPSPSSFLFPVSPSEEFPI